MAASIESNDDGGCVGVTESATENANDALPSVPTLPSLNDNRESFESYDCNYSDLGTTC